MSCKYPCSLYIRSSVLVSVAILLVLILAACGDSTGELPGFYNAIPPQSTLPLHQWSRRVLAMVHREQVLLYSLRQRQQLEATLIVSK